MEKPIPNGGIVALELLELSIAEESGGRVVSSMQDDEAQTSRRCQRDNFLENLFKWRMAGGECGLRSFKIALTTVKCMTMHYYYSTICIRERLAAIGIEKLRLRLV